MEPGADGGATAETTTETAAETATERAIVSVDGQRYALDELPAELRELLVTLRTADALIAMRQDKLQVLQRGRTELRQRLGQGLATVAPLAETAPASAETDAWRSNLSQD